MNGNLNHEVEKSQTKRRSNPNRRSPRGILFSFIFFFSFCLKQKLWRHTLRVAMCANATGNENGRWKASPAQYIQAKVEAIDCTIRCLLSLENSTLSSVVADASVPQNWSHPNVMYRPLLYSINCTLLTTRTKQDATQTATTDSNNRSSNNNQNNSNNTKKKTKGRNKERKRDIKTEFSLSSLQIECR